MAPNHLNHPLIYVQGAASEPHCAKPPSTTYPNHPQPPHRHSCRYKELLQNPAVAPGIVMVEEAGELLEAHTLSSLSSKTKALIMVGLCVWWGTCSVVTLVRVNVAPTFPILRYCLPLA